MKWTALENFLVRQSHYWSIKYLWSILQNYAITQFNEPKQVEDVFARRTRLIIAKRFKAFILLHKYAYNLIIRHLHIVIDKRRKKKTWRKTTFSELDQGRFIGKMYFCLDKHQEVVRHRNLFYRRLKDDINDKVV